MEIDVNEKKQSQYPEVCGKCEMGFDTTQEYLDHICGETGYKPSEPENLGKAFVQVSRKALERGEIRKELEAEGVDTDEAKLRAVAIQRNPKLRTARNKNK